MNFQFRYSRYRSGNGTQEAALSKSTQMILRNEEVWKPWLLFSISCHMDQNALNKKKGTNWKLQLVQTKGPERSLLSLARGPTKRQPGSSRKLWGNSLLAPWVKLWPHPLPSQQRWSGVPGLSPALSAPYLSSPLSSPPLPRVLSEKAE